MSGDQTLGDVMRRLQRVTGRSLKDLTVMDPKLDPFRFDTAAGHRNGRWFRDAMEAAGLLTRERPIHLRGAHYAVTQLVAGADPTRHGPDLCK